MKFTKLVPIALALSLVSPAFADPSPSATSTMNLTMPHYINIVADTTNASQALVPDYDTPDIGTLTAKVVWNVTTNLNGDYVYLSAKAREDGAQKASLYGDDSNLYIVFTNIGGDAENPGEGPAEDTIADTMAAAASAGGATSTDAISFALSEVFVGSGAATGHTPAKKALVDGSSGAPALAKVRRYTLKNGSYAITNALSSVYGASFDTYDTQGIYQAVLTLSNTNP